MDLNYLYKLASLLDSQGKYVESDVVYDSMLRIAAPDGRGRTQGRARPRDSRPRPLTQEQIRARLKPNSPGLVPVQSTPPVAPQAAAPQATANPAAAASRFTPKQLVNFLATNNADMKAMLGYVERNGYNLEEFATAYDAQYGAGKFKFDFERVQQGLPAGPKVRMPKVNPNVRSQVMSDRAFRQLLNRFETPEQLDDFLKNSADKESFVKKFNDLYGPNAYEQRLTGGPRSSPQQSRGQQPGGQSSARPGANQSGSAGRGGPNPNTGTGTANSAGAGSRPSGTGGSASAGGASPKPGGPSGYAGPKPKFDPIPENFNPIKAGANAAEYRRLILSQPGLRPEIAARLEMLVDRGLLDPKTGNWTRNLNDLQLSELERFYRNLGKAQNAVSDAASAGSKAGRGGAAAAAAAKASQFATKAANNPSTAKIVSALSKASTTLGALRPLLKVLPFLGFAASIPEMMNLVNKINQKGWESIWNDPYDRAKAIGAISNTVSAAVSLAPGPLTPVALALAAIGIGSDVGADVARDAGDAAEGGEFKLFGKTLKQKSQQRKQQEAFDAGYNAKELDPQVVSALENSKSLLSSGKKIIDIINDQSMLAKYPWLNNNADPKNAQFRKNIVLLSKSLRAQQSPAQVSSPGATNQPGQSVYNNAQQSAQPEKSQQLRNHNDLLYKAYVDTVQTTNITLENLKNYRDQIITKINNLAPMYPNINAQLAITALDNRIRKYSAQAKPA